MKQSLALGILVDGKSVFLTGPAGSGKTYVLNQFIKYARKNGKKVAVTASTGLAATHLGGNTIHSWAGIGIADELSRHMVEGMSKSRVAQIESADILVIDEVSMLHDYRLDMVDQITRSVRKSPEPFGGLQVVLCGDFFQLPPINREDGRSGGFVTGSSAWHELDPVVCYLEEQHRQNDDELADILAAFRAGDLRRRHVEALLARKRTITPFDEATTELYTHNQNVDIINSSRLASVEGEQHDYEMTATGRKSAVETLKRSCLAPEVLCLKAGAFVMFVKNSLERKYVNGTLGVVEGFEEVSGLPIVKTKDGRSITADYDSWELRDGEKKLASLSQIPLRLAWAITVHKSQGMTLDSAHIDLSRAFVPGMGYVAISRVRSLESLSLGGINKTALMMNQEAAEIDQKLQKSSLRSEMLFEKLNGSWEKKSAKKVSKNSKKSGIWVERLAKMRLTHPNAYTPWSEADDAKLIKLHQSGQKTEQLSELFGRHPGSITSRLEKLLEV